MSRRSRDGSQAPSSLGAGLDQLDQVLRKIPAGYGSPLPALSVEAALVADSPCPQGHAELGLAMLAATEATGSLDGRADGSRDGSVAARQCLNALELRRGTRLLPQRHRRAGSARR